MATQSVKDILNTEVPKPSFVLSPSVPAPLPSGVTVTRNGQDNVARTLDPYSGKFEHVPEDTPRVYGADQSLLVEGATRTNHVRYSSDLSQWQNINATLGVSRNSIFPDSAYGYDASGSSALDRFERRSGLTTGNPETAYIIVEQETAAEVGMYVKDSTDGSGSEALRVIYNWSNDSFTIQRQNFGTINATYSRDLNAPHPNDDGALRVLVMRYTFDTSGNGRDIGFHPDFTGSGDSTILHHAQIEEAPNASSPIVTGSSAQTRAGDEYTIFDYSNDPDQDYPDWYNANQGTVFIELEELTNKGFYPLTNGTFRITRGGDHERWYFTDGGSNISVDESSLTVKISASFNSTERVLSVNGASNANSTTQISHFDSSIFNFGDIPSNLIKRFVYYPRALPESTLNVLTT